MAVVAAVAGNKRPVIFSAHRQRGAVAVFVALSITALLIGTMLAIELGRVYSTQRQLQKAATMAALDGARVVGGCTSGNPTQTMLNTRVSSSLAANGYGATSGITAVAEAGRIQTSTGGIQQRSLAVSGFSTANAARVTLQVPFPTQFIPLFTPGGSMRASATATQDVLGSVRVGSGVAKFSGGLVNQLMSGLLGGNVTLTAADYNGLVNTNITAGQLATAIGLSVTDLADPLKIATKTPILSSALNNLAGALSGSVSNQVKDALLNLAGQSTNSAPIQLGSILSPLGAVAADVPVLNLGDLVQALAIASRAGSTIQIPVNLDVAGIAAVKVFADVIQPPKPSPLGRPGVTQASTEQITLKIRIEIGPLLTTLTNSINLVAGTLNAALKTLTNLLGLLGLGIGLPTIDSLNLPNIGVDVAIAPAIAYLDRIDCPRADVASGNPVAGLSVKTGLANVQVGTYTGAATAANPRVLGSAPLNLLTIHVPKCTGLVLLGACVGSSTVIDVPVGLTLAGNINVSSTVKTLKDVKEFTVLSPQKGTTPPLYRANGAMGTPTVPAASGTNPNPQTAGSSTSVSLSLVKPAPNTQGLDLSNLLTVVTNIVQPLLNLVNGLASSLINPLLSALGLQLGTATVWMETVTIGQPTIVTTAVPPATP